ncbi:MAG: helix-turn-helix transcriptional regulator [Clostridia bacterium]|nr:helix-turn-helix transcriptional regulator [Clostridia bacterium]MBR5768431.1 helix-turn-helix transcriptional regulator [Clostridia bacterium]
MNIGEKIAGLRTAGNMSQQALADLLHVSRELVSKWENGTRRPDRETIENIAGIFGVPADSVIDRGDLVFEELGECVPTGEDLPGDALVTAVNAFLRALPRREADVFMNRYYFLKTAAEISEKFGIGENHVRSMLSKTRKKFRKYLKEGRF